MPDRDSRSNRVGSDRIGPTDPRYADLVGRGFNKRFVPRPDYVRLVASSDQVADAVQTAVREGKRLAVRSGGHCLENFVGDPAVRVLVDTSAMAGVAYDPDFDAFAIEAGPLLGEVYRRLYRGWGVLLPAGQSPTVGIGGHVMGGAFGFLHRQHGLAVDHLYAVEVVVVDAGGRASTIVATRDPADPNHDLWWAHTGGGGGNFGVVTRYWFRSPDAAPGDARARLPRAPESVLVFRASWNWSDVDEAAFTRLARNFGDWCERNSVAGSAECDLFSLLLLNPRAAGALELKGLATGAHAERLFDEHLAAIGDGVVAPATRGLERLSWLEFALRPFPELFGPVGDGAFVKVKDALLRKGLSTTQLARAFPYMNGAEHPGGTLGLATYGGAVNIVRPDATATSHRSAIIDMACSAGWGDPGQEAPTLAWVRSLYRDLFADTGGVPVPGPSTDGVLINHPDSDLANPEWNTSGTAWPAFYYQGNYRRLQEIKRRYDPGNVFRHSLSIEPA
jgi:FAD/FMN-containing dehydrogenase